MKQKPHGGKLVDLMVEGAAAEQAKARAKEELQLNDRQLCDVELIINGGFSPLTGFMVRCVALGLLGWVRWAGPLGSNKCGELTTCCTHAPTL